MSDTEAMRRERDGFEDAFLAAREDAERLAEALRRTHEYDPDDPTNIDCYACRALAAHEAAG